MELTRQKFIRAMSIQLSLRIIPTQPATQYVSMAALILRENLIDLDIRYGDTGQRWSKSEATDMVDYEMECAR